jgi:1,4-dihydroxy-6-naphthoate synthase
MHQLTLAHSGDPDDAFMWWPLTGKVWPDGSPRGGRDAGARIASDRFSFTAVPGDISQFNRLAARSDAEGGAPYDITALSVRAWADVAARYLMTNCGSSFGEGYGPKLVCAAGSSLADVAALREALAAESCRIAVPGLRTSAFMTMCLMLGDAAQTARERGQFIEVAFDQIIPAVRDGRAEVGLVIHEGQVLYERAGMRLVQDLGAWWKQSHGLPLPLGVNAIKRDLDARFGPGSIREVAGLLERSLDHAMQHRDESIDYTMAFAELNAKASAIDPPDRDTVERYIDLYVTALTVDMGQEGATAIRWLLNDGAAAGLCPAVSSEDIEVA